MKFKVTYEGGEVVEVNAGPRAQVAFERHFNISLADGKRMEHIYYLAWAALHFGGREANKDFDDFLNRIADVDPLDEEPPDPTRPARQRGKSPRSASQPASPSTT